MRVDRLADDPPLQPTHVVDSANPLAALVVRTVAEVVERSRFGPRRDGRGGVGSPRAGRSRRAIAEGPGRAEGPGPFGRVDDGVHALREVEERVLKGWRDPVRRKECSKAASASASVRTSSRPIARPFSMPRTCGVVQRCQSLMYAGYDTDMSLTIRYGL